VKREPDRFDDLADAVGDGRPVDWAAARDRAADAAERALLEHLESISWIRRAFSELAARDQGELVPAARPLGPPKEREAGPPALVGSYTIRSLVGEGPLGSVYLVEHAGSGGPPLALKLIRWRLDSARVLDRFEALRGALAHFAGSGIVPTLEAGESDEGRVWFVHDFVDGPSILEHCCALGLDLRRRLELFAAACDLVQAIHAAGLRHGALKPGNVLVERGPGEACPRILDLGVAEALNQRSTERALFTDYGRPFRDLCYFSPEETGAGGDPPDARSDVYALGVLLYEVIAGQPPFGPRLAPRAEVAEFLLRIREGSPEPLNGRSDLQLTSRTAELLDGIVHRALAKDRSCRQQSAAELAVEVRHLLEEHPEGLG
jgi:serine/threonine-protein kinase